MFKQIVDRKNQTYTVITENNTWTNKYYTVEQVQHLKHIFNQAEYVWQQAQKEYVAQNGDQGSCIGGNGVQGSLTMECTRNVAEEVLRSHEIDASYNEGWMN